MKPTEIHHRTCTRCGGPKNPNARLICARCLRIGNASRRRWRDRVGHEHEAQMSAAEVEARLAADVARELLPPWDRHPQEWTNVVARTPVSVCAKTRDNVLRFPGGEERREDANRRSEGG